MIVAKIRRDYITKKPEDLTKNTWEWVNPPPECNLVGCPIVDFILKDDDGIIYYGGWLINDDACEVQAEVLSWAKIDSGCTEIWVRDEDGYYIQEIG